MSNLQTVIGMLRRAASFEKLPAAQQAALRAQVSRMTRTNSDAQIAEVLTQIRLTIGEADDRKESGGMTAADLDAEYAASYASYDPRRRAAFKSRLTKVRKVAEQAGDAESVAAVDQLADTIREAEESEARAEIRKLAEALRKSDN